MVTSLRCGRTLPRGAGRVRKSGGAVPKPAGASPRRPPGIFLYFWSRDEVYLAQLATNRKDQAGETLASLRKLMRDEVSSYLELAVDYGSFAAWD
jgi:hypothetical protein